LHDPAGLDVAALMAHKHAGRPLIEYERGRKLARDAIIDIECEIWIPAARPDVIDAANVDRLRTKMVLQGANIPVTEPAERRLAERGILSVPDFIANAGGVICAAVEYHGGSERQAFAEIEEKIARNTAEVLAAVREAGKLPRAAAVELALSRVRKAMDRRRFGILG